jgi:hypothetical protein
MKPEHQSTANRVAVWAAIIPMGLYVLNMGQWVGAADEKLKDAQTVEITQRAILLQQATLAAGQENLKESVEELKKQAKEDKKEILQAIKEASEDD